MTREAIHQGETPCDYFYALGMSAAELAPPIEVPLTRTTEFLNSRHSITADTALRPGHYFGMSVKFRLNLQMLYDLPRSEHKNSASIAPLRWIAATLRGPWIEPRPPYRD